jgi:transposase-like protein
MTTRRQYGGKFKARLVIEAIRGETALNQLGSHFGVHPVQIAHWRRAAPSKEGFVRGFLNYEGHSVLSRLIH